MNTQNQMARSVAPEDLKKNMYVALMSITREEMPYFCDTASVFERGEPFKITWLPDDHETQPLKVVSVCLPFVFVRDALRVHHTLDVRRHRLAQISDEFGRKCFKATRAARKAQAKSKK